MEIRQRVPCRAIRGNSISVNSTLPPSYPPPLPPRVRREGGILGIGLLGILGILGIGLLGILGIPKNRDRDQGLREVYCTVTLAYKTPS